MVVLIGDADPAELSPVVRALLPADVSSRTIVSAARLVAEGLLILPDGALERLAAMVAEPAEEDDHTGPSSATLTPREKQVLERLAAGASNKAIARELDVSVHTVKFHVASLLRKLRASGRLEAVGIGLRTGLLMV
jgi:DNA-binding NarL/FixJ family response regulator